MNTSSQARYRTPAPPVNPSQPFFHPQNPPNSPKSTLRTHLSPPVPRNDALQP